MVRVSRSAAGLGSFAVDVALLRLRMKDDDEEAGAASTPMTMMMGEERGPMIPDVASWDQRNKHVILGRSMMGLFTTKSTSCQSKRRSSG